MFQSTDVYFLVSMSGQLKMANCGPMFSIELKLKPTELFHVKHVFNKYRSLMFKNGMPFAILDFEKRDSVPSVR